MAENKKPTYRRDILRASAGAGLLSVTGLTAGSVVAQEETTPQDGAAAGIFSYSLQEGDEIKVANVGVDQEDNIATETVPAACLDGESAQEYQFFSVRVFRDGTNLWYRSLLVPEIITEIEIGTTETTAEETPTMPEAAAELPTIRLGEWYRVTSSEQCNGLFAVELEPMEAPETTPEP